jgi:6-phosphofructokinase 2
LDADGPALADSIEAHPYMIKVNRREMERLVGHPISDESSAMRAAESIHQAGVSVVVVTRGREGAVAVDNEGGWAAVAPRIHTVSTVGAGDAFLGAMVTTMSSGGSLYDGLRLGCAAGTATCLTPGTELCSQSQIDEFLPKVKVHNLSEARL